MKSEPDPRMMMSHMSPSAKKFYIQTMDEILHKKERAAHRAFTNHIAFGTTFLAFQIIFHTISYFTTGTFL